MSSANVRSHLYTFWVVVDVPTWGTYMITYLEVGKGTQFGC